MMVFLMGFGFTDAQAQNDCQNLVNTTINSDMGTLDEICFGTTLIHPRELFISEINRSGGTTRYVSGFEITGKVGSYSASNYGLAFYRRCSYDNEMGTDVGAFEQAGTIDLGFTISSPDIRVNGQGYGSIWFDVDVNNIETTVTINGNTNSLNTCEESQGFTYAIAFYKKGIDTDEIIDFLAFTNNPSLFINGGVADGKKAYGLYSSSSAIPTTPLHTYQLGIWGWKLKEETKATVNDELMGNYFKPYYALKHSFPEEDNLPTIHTIAPSLRTTSSVSFSLQNCEYPIDFRNYDTDLWDGDPTNIEKMYDWETDNTEELEDFRTTVLRHHYVSIKFFEYMKEIHGHTNWDYEADEWCPPNTFYTSYYPQAENINSALGKNISVSNISSYSVAHERGHHLQRLTPSGINTYGLSEGVPDIWGVLVDRFAFQKAKPTYDGGIRALSTYTNIYDDSMINTLSIGNDFLGRLHAQGQAIRHWFYLLAEGLDENDTGERSLNLPYMPCTPYEFTIDVEGIGYEIAERIFFEMLWLIDAENSSVQAYPTEIFGCFADPYEDIDFFDVKEASIMAVDVLENKGEISAGDKQNIINSLNQAWAAIGVEEGFLPLPTDDCIRIDCNYNWNYRQFCIDKPIHVVAGGQINFGSGIANNKIFQENGEIIVEPGGRVNITAANLYPVDGVDTWKGITVLGVNNNIFPFVADNGILPTGYPTSNVQHGVVHISGGGIYQAELALHAPNSYNFSAENCGDYVGEVNTKGGIVVMTGGTLRDNIQDISMNNMNVEGTYGGENPSMFKNMKIERSEDGSSMRLEGFDNFRFLNNEVNGVDSNTGIGLLLFDTQIHAKNNQFNNIKQAIKKDNIGGGVGCSCGVSELSVFDNNTFTRVKQGITVLGGSLDMFLNNTFSEIPKGGSFTFGGPLHEKDSYGIYSIFHPGFEMYNNQFHGFPSLRPWEEANGGSYGIIVYESEDWTNTATENKFEGLDYGISTQGYNPFLQINCNLFANDNRPHNATAWAVVDGELPTQGSSCNNTDTPAGNEWGHLTVDCATNVAKYDMILGQEIAPFGYFAHQNSTNHRTTPDLAACVENPPIVQIEGCVFIKDEDSCEGGLSVQSPIDKPDAVLVTDIQDIDSELAILENDLVNKETEKNNTNDPILLKQIEEEIQTIKTKIYRLENTKIRFLGVLEDVVGVEQTLDNSHSSAAKKRLIQLYLAQGLYQISRTELLNMQQYITSHHLSDYNLYVQLMTIVIDAIEQQRNYTSTELADLQTIANTGTSAASIQANVILYRLNGEIYHPPIRKIGTNAAKRSIEETPNSLIQVYPNPAKDNITVRNSTNKGKVFIFNNVGKLIKTLFIESKSSTTSIDVSNWSNGLYFYQFITADNQIQNGKLMIQR